MDSESDGANIWGSNTDLGESVVFDAVLRTTRTGESDVDGRATQSMMPLIKDDMMIEVNGLYLRWMCFISERSSLKGRVDFDY